ncbi:MAG: hypothetical protein QM572_07305 [Nocardioides sp.]|uniref:hypothetical protein n=1 Tax=Nocardioides sp. TaxID=35761 RepID=UPI0039E65D80
MSNTNITTATERAPGQRAALLPLMWRLHRVTRGTGWMTNLDGYLAGIEDAVADLRRHASPDDGSADA